MKYSSLFLLLGVINTLDARIVCGDSISMQMWASMTADSSAIKFHALSNAVD